MCHEIRQEDWNADCNAFGSAISQQPRKAAQPTGLDSKAHGRVVVTRVGVAEHPVHGYIPREHCLDPEATQWTPGYRRLPRSVLCAEQIRLND